MSPRPRSFLFFVASYYTSRRHIPPGGHEMSSSTRAGATALFSIRRRITTGNSKQESPFFFFKEKDITRIGSLRHRQVISYFVVFVFLFTSGIYTYIHTYILKLFIFREVLAGVGLYAYKYHSTICRLYVHIIQTCSRRVRKDGFNVKNISHTIYIPYMLGRR